MHFKWKVIVSFSVVQAKCLLRAGESHHSWETAMCAGFYTYGEGLETRMHRSCLVYGLWEEVLVYLSVRLKSRLNCRQAEYSYNDYDILKVLGSRFYVQQRIPLSWITINSPFLAWQPFLIGTPFSASQLLAAFENGQSARERQHLETDPFVERRWLLRVSDASGIKRKLKTLRAINSLGNYGRWLNSPHETGTGLAKCCHCTEQILN